MGDAGQVIDWRWIDFNPAFERMSGLTGKKGQLFSEIVPELEPEWAERYGHVIATGETLRFELPVGGLDSWYDAFVSRIGGEGSRRLVVVFTNITARKRAEEALRESEERQAFLLTLSDALRTEFDPDRMAERALSLLHRQLGLDRTYIARIRGQDHPVDIVAELGRDDLPPMPAELRPADFPKGFEKAAEGLLIVDDIGAHPEFTELDRRSLDAVGLTAFIVVPLHRGAEGMIWAMVAGSRRARVWTPGEASLVQETAERTWGAVERASAEIALRDSEERFVQFASASSGGIWIRDAGTLAIEYASPAFGAMYGAQPSEVSVGIEQWAAMIVPDDRASALERIRRARQGEAIVHEFRIQRPSDDAFRWIRDTGFPLEVDGHVQRIGGIAEDITDAKLAVEHIDRPGGARPAPDRVAAQRRTARAGYFALARNDGGESRSQGKIAGARRCGDGRGAQPRPPGQISPSQDDRTDPPGTDQRERRRPLAHTHLAGPAVGPTSSPISPFGPHGPPTDRSGNRHRPHGPADLAGAPAHDRHGRTVDLLLLIHPIRPQPQVDR